METRSIWSWSGRDSRREFLLVQLVCLLAALCVGGWFVLIDHLAEGDRWLASVAALLTCLPIFGLQIASGARRLHDLGKSGWFALLLVPPLVNCVLVVVLLFARGQSHPNQYGAPPRSAEISAKNAAWTSAYQELNSEHRDHATWAQAFAHAHGDRNKADARYLDKRSQELFVPEEPQGHTGWPELSGIAVLACIFVVGTLVQSLNGVPATGAGNDRTSALASTPAPCETPPSDPASVHYCTIYAAHPDFMEISKSRDFRAYVERKPGASRIVTQGTAKEIINLLDDYKARAFLNGLAAQTTPPKSAHP